jgi:TonB-linked SusC/RagA family outer membrane protein
MRITCIMLAFCMSSVFATTVNSQNAKVVLSGNSLTVRQLVVQIEKQTNYLFVLNSDKINLNQKVELSERSSSVKNILNDAFADAEITYRLEGENIILIKPDQQGRTVKGKVVDENGLAIIGASVMEKGTQNGTITAADGTFSLSVKRGSQIVISYIGYTTVTITANPGSSVKVVLQEAANNLNEVVVVGYGTQKKGMLTGSVSTVSSKELLKAPMQNVSNLLTGKISGLTSIQSTGKPGADGTAMLIRGYNSFSGNSPMVVVDGVPRPIDYVNPNDIESISVLKDAAASIYGIQGANGVILITTKSGGDGPAKIAYDGSITATENTAMPKYLNARDYMYWNNMARQMDGLTPLWTAEIQNKVLSNDPNSIWGETNWMDMIFRTGFTQQHNVSASGGTERTKYFASVGYMDQNGTLKNTSYKRYNVRANLDVLVAKNLRFSTNLSGFRSDIHWPGTSIENQSEFNPIRQAIFSIPILKSEYKGYPTAWQTGSYYVNGYAALKNSGYQKRTMWVFDSNFKLEYDFSGITNVLKGLKASLFGAYNYSNTGDSDYDRYYELYAINNTLDESIQGASGYLKGNTYSKSASWGDTWVFRPQIDYARDFNKHHVDAVFFYEAQKSYSNTMTGVKRGYYSDDPVDISLGTIFTTTPVTGSHWYSGQASWAGRVNYAYDQKYLAEFAFRRDGSYVFAPENRWGFFPSASVGWVVSSENFFQKALPVVDYFKIRASWGESGNDNVTPYLYNSNYAIANNSFVLGGTSVAQFYSTNAYIYRNLTWSKTTSWNLGFDADLWNGKLGIEFDLFYQLTKDILESKSGSYPTSLGEYYPSYANSGRVDNRGFELTLKHRYQVTKDLSYSLKGMFSFARNRVLREALTDNYPNYRGVLGKPMGRRYGFKALGLFQSQEEIDAYPVAPSGSIHLGDIKYQDVNGDGIISSRYDYVKTGYGQIPEINFSFNADINYKNFYMTMLWQGVSHCDYELSGVYDTGVTASTAYTAIFAEGGNAPYYLINGAWRPDHTNAKYPRLTTLANGNNAWQSTWWVVNGEYLRLKNLNIGYSVPASLLKNTPFTRINVYVAGTNLITLSHFKYVDPESPSVSNGYYPQQKTYSFGVNLTF